MHTDNNTSSSSDDDDSSGGGDAAATTSNGNTGGAPEINLESLKALREVFESADADGAGELDADAFYARLGPHLGRGLTRAQVHRLFLSIDADAGGTVSWDEFTRFMFLERAQHAGDESNADNWRLFPQEFRDRNEPSSRHRDRVDRVVHVPQADKYVTCGRDGSVRVWNAPDLKHVRTIPNCSAWVTDATYLPLGRRLVVTAMDRGISSYDMQRGSYELTGRVYASGAMGAPLCLCSLAGDAGERVVYGDTAGAAVLLLCGGRELPARDLISTDEHKDYLYLHREHADWVTRAQYVPELGLVTSSLDATVKIWDVAHERLAHTCRHHTKGVHAFAWCRALSVFVSCGVEHDAAVWQGATGRKVGELRGHTSSVLAVAVDEATNHVFTMAADRTVKLWDLRNHRCLQTVGGDGWARGDDARPGAMAHDASRRRLVTAAARPYVWHHKPAALDRSGHRDPLAGALYNPVFNAVVSADEAGIVCVWRLADGARDGRFGPAHGGSRLTSLAFDANGRRLVTGANDGAVRMWNFSNGGMLRAFEHDGGAAAGEVCAVLFARDDKRGGDVVYAAGWDKKVFAWQDEGEPVTTAHRTFEGHHADVLALAASHERELLASGDADGRVCVWGLFTGERKATIHALPPSSGGGGPAKQQQAQPWLQQQHQQQQLSASTASGIGVESLAWLEAWSPAQVADRRRRSAAAAAARAASAAARRRMEAAADAQGDEEQQRTAGTADGEGSVASDDEASDELADLALFEDAGISNDAATDDSGVAAATALLPQKATLVLLGACTDGLLRAWTLDRASGGGRLLFALPAAQGRLDAATVVRAAASGELVVAGDSGGHVRVWDLSRGIDVASASTANAAAAGFVQRAHWRAHSGGVAGADIVPSSAAAGGPLLITAGRDCDVAVWTPDGRLVGKFGAGGWDLRRPSTWADANGIVPRPPSEPDAGLFCASLPGGGLLMDAAGGARGGGGGGGGAWRRAASVMLLCAPNAAAAPSAAAPNFGGAPPPPSWFEGGAAAGVTSAATTGWLSTALISDNGGAGSSGSGTNSGAATARPPGRQTCEDALDGAACAAAAAAAGARDFGGAPLAQLVLQEARARAVVGAPPAPERPRLGVQALDDGALRSAEPVLAGAAKRRAKAASAVAAGALYSSSGGGGGGLTVRSTRINSPSRGSSAGGNGNR